MIEHFRNRSRVRAYCSDEPIVIIVDDDASVREALTELVVSAGLDALCYASTRAFLEAGAPDRPCCLIVDVRMPGGSGLELQEQLGRSGDPRPIVFLTGYGDIPMTVQAMKAGAVDFLTKPVRDQTLSRCCAYGDCKGSGSARASRRRSNAISAVMQR